MTFSSRLNIVLVNPEIPQNTGNVARTCIGLGATLHFVGSKGFSLEDKYLKRAGLDYWPKLLYREHKDWDEFVGTLEATDDLCLFSTKGKVELWDRNFRLPCYLVFGSESKGLPRPLYDKYEKELVRIPISGDIRSLNLATAVGVATFEVVRQTRKVSGEVSR